MFTSAFEDDEDIINLIRTPPETQDVQPDPTDVMITQQLPNLNEVELDQNIMDLIEQVSGSQVNFDNQPFRQMLFLDEVAPNAVQTQYVECFRPGTNNQLFQTHDGTQTDNLGQPQSTQTKDQTQSTQTFPSVSSQTEETPVLLNSTDYIQSLNSLKNNMIQQLLKDNIAMTKAKLHSRQKALEEMEKTFDLQVTADNTESFDESSMRLFSNLLQLKEQFISKLLAENVTTHPALYQLHQQLTQLK